VAINKDLFLKDFGNHIRNLRLAKNLSQLELASRINKDRQSIQRLECGNVNPTIYYLMELSEGLETDLKTIVHFTPKQRKRS
jgi:putative transcriptional regulator